MRNVRTPRARRALAAGPAEIPLARDLAALLSGDQSVYFRFGPEGAVMAAKASEKSFAFGLAIDERWRRMTPEERAERVLSWIRKAASYARHPRIRWAPA